MHTIPEALQPGAALQFMQRPNKALFAALLRRFGGPRRKQYEKAVNGCRRAVREHLQLAPHLRR